MGLWDDFKDYFRIGMEDVNPREQKALEDKLASESVPIDEFTGGSSAVPSNLNLPELEASQIQKETDATKEQALLNEISDLEYKKQAEQTDLSNYVTPGIQQQAELAQQQKPVSLLDTQLMKDTAKIAGGLGYAPSLVKQDTSKIDKSMKEDIEANKAFQLSEMERKNKIAQEIRGFDQKIDEFKKTPEMQYIRDQKIKIENSIAQKEKESKKLDAESSQKIDPNRFWNNKEGWQKALILIGQSMAAFASGFSGRENTAFKLLMKSIDDDIDAQKESIKNATAKKIQADNTIQNLMSQGFSLNQAELQARAAQYNQLMLQVNAIAQYESTPEHQKIAAQKMAADMNQELEKIKFAYQNDISKTNASAINEANKNKATIMAKFYESALREKSKGAGGVVTIGNPLVDKINSKFSGNEDFVSKENYKALRKEADEYQKFLTEGKTKFIAFKNLNNGSFFNDFLPSFLGGQREIRKSDIANMAAAIIKDVPGLRSDPDYRNIILPMLPSIISTSKTRGEVIEKMAKTYEDAKLNQFSSLHNSQEFKPEMTKMAIESGFLKAKREFEKSIAGVK